MNMKNKFKLNIFVFQKIMQDKTIPSGAKLVLYNLKSRLGGKNYSFPSQETIAKDIGLTARQVRNHLALLRKRGILTWKRSAFNPKTKSRLNSNQYDLSAILVQK
jgi:DNA-binding MarR family transcriptional regulator